MNEIVHSTDVLQMASSKGLTKYWQGFVVTDGSDFFIKSHSWQDLAGGGLSKVNEGVPNRVAGKNIGRANETSPKDQAIFEITSKENKKRDEGYCEEGKVADILPLPMLAHKFTERGHNIKYPCYAQPKLDGMRCTCQGGKFWTRKGKLIDPKIVAHIELPSDNLIYDGELILPKPFGFQDTMTAAKKFRPADKVEISSVPGLLKTFHTAMLQFNVFDVVMENVTFKDRLTVLCNEFLGFKPACNDIDLVDTVLVESEADVTTIHAQYTAAGYEGTILRNMDGLYRIGQRSADLQKLKDFEDAEFMITDVVDGRGREEGAAIYVCKTKEGRPFSVRPKGTIEERQKILANASSYIGRELTVKFQGLSDDGLPRFPIGIAVRDYE